MTCRGWPAIRRRARGGEPASGRGLTGPGRPVKAGNRRPDPRVLRGHPRARAACRPARVTCLAGLADDAGLTGLAGLADGVRFGRAVGSGLGPGVAGRDLLRGHRQSRCRGRYAGSDRLKDQQCHRVPGIGGQGSLRGHVGQRAVAGLPGGEGQQRGRRGHVPGRHPPHHVGPQPQVRLDLFRHHPGPGVVTDPQVGQGHRQPGQAVVPGDPAAAPVRPDRLADRAQALGGDPLGGPAPAAGSRARPDQVGSVPFGAADGLAHRLLGQPAERGDRGGQGGPVAQRLVAGRGHRRGGGVRDEVERHALGRAAARVMAGVGPVPAVLDAQRVVQRDIGQAQLADQRVRHGRDHRRGSVADRDGQRELVPGQDRSGVRGDLGRRGGVRRLGQVVTEGQLDTAARRACADDDQAPARVKAEQARDHGQHRVRRADAEQRRGPGRRGGRGVSRAGAGRLGIGGRRVLIHAASVRWPGGRGERRTTFWG